MAGKNKFLNQDEINELLNLLEAGKSGKEGQQQGIFRNRADRILHHDAACHDLRTHRSRQIRRYRSEDRPVLKGVLQHKLGLGDLGRNRRMRLRDQRVRLSFHLHVQRKNGDFRKPCEPSDIAHRGNAFDSHLCSCFRRKISGSNRLGITRLHLPGDLVHG